MNIKARLLHALPEWYPELKTQPYSCTQIQHTKYRWSEHFIFQVHTNEALHNGKQILIKILKDKSASGRVQDSKIRPSDSAELEYAGLFAIYNQFKQVEIKGLMAIRPLALFPDINGLALEYLPGKNLLAMMQAAGKWPVGGQKNFQYVEEIGYKSGQLLASVHKIEKEDCPNQQSFSYEAFDELVQEKIEQLCGLDASIEGHPTLTKTQNSLREKFLDSNEMLTVSFLHGDYYPLNIVHLENGQIFTIDTTLHQQGPVEQDIAKFLSGVEITKRKLLLGLTTSPNIVSEKVNQAFLNGYRSIGKINDSVLRAFQFVALLQRWIEILGVVESRMPSWISFMLKKIRITPFMLRTLSNLHQKIEAES